ncbi:MAG: tRNA (adenosine(37)-N6)-threonylcarbamoyltransferase complex ATPase subunit type 1 TsaE [Lachnospiraceae bacterium]|nr:tRNA (adenosine(37)-N6)-threonylcarbamoyltransferase complex ATPase subunit type 1 TsaE [Lachnospiraceae bacterium]
MTSETFSQTETFDIGKHIGENAKAGDIITLSGDLGVGKTVFAQGVAAGLGIKDHVCSPTFTILQVYDDGRLPLYHFDTYRIEDPGEMEAIGYEDYFFGDGVCIIEWPEMVDDLLPDTVTAVSIFKDPSKGTDYRRITVA